MYKLGQLRRNQISSYSTNINYKTGLVINNNETTFNFYDPNILINDGGQLSSSYSYYLRFKVKQKTDSVQDFVIKLNNSVRTLDNDDFQSIKTLSVKSGIDYNIFEIIFNPSATYNQIVFELKRIEVDFSTFEGDRRGRVMEIEVLNFYMINNIITDYLQSRYSDLQNLKKIGIQGPPGLMFTINGEEIRLGKTGIYELSNEKIVISYLGFIIKESSQIPDGKDFFILDFKY